jgi:hypothetical protein
MPHGQSAVSHSVTNSMAHGDAISRHVPTHIFAPSVAVLDTMPNPAIADPHKVVTPLILEAWEKLLATAGVLSEFLDVPHGLRNGFCLGVSSSLSVSHIYPNHASATDMPDVIEARDVERATDTEPYPGTRIRVSNGQVKLSRGP